MKYAIAFVLVALLDWAYALYTIHAVARNAHKASVYAAMIYGASGLATLAIVKDPYVLIAAIAGAYVGTYLAVRTK